MTIFVNGTAVSNGPVHVSRSSNSRHVLPSHFVSVEIDRDGNTVTTVMPSQVSDAPPVATSSTARRRPYVPSISAPPIVVHPLTVNIVLVPRVTGTDPLGTTSRWAIGKGR